MSERIGLMKQKKLCDDIKVCLWKKNTKTRVSKNKVFILAFLNIKKAAEQLMQVGDLQSQMGFKFSEV